MQVREKESFHNSKHQQLVAGASILAYWLSALLWDLLMYSIPMTITLVMVKVLDMEGFIHYGAYGAMWVLFLGFGLSMIPFCYLISGLFPKRATPPSLPLPASNHDHAYFLVLGCL